MVAIHCCGDDPSAEAADKVTDNADAEPARRIGRIHYPDLGQRGRDGSRQSWARVEYLQVELRSGGRIGAFADPRAEADFAT